MGYRSSIDDYSIVFVYAFLRRYIQTPIINFHNLPDTQQIVSTITKVTKAVQFNAEPSNISKMIKAIQPIAKPLVPMPIDIESEFGLPQLGNWIWEKADGLPGGRPTLILAVFAFLYFGYSEIQNSKRRSPRPGCPCLPPFRRAHHHEIVQPIKIYT